MENEDSKTYYAVFSFSMDPNWDNYWEALYIGHFRKQGEKWLSYKVTAKELPNDRDLAKI
jgi:hypothetical protein